MGRIKATTSARETGRFRCRKRPAGLLRFGGLLRNFFGCRRKAPRARRRGLRYIRGSSLRSCLSPSPSLLLFLQNLSVLSDRNGEPGDTISIGGLLPPDTPRFRLLREFFDKLSRGNYPSDGIASSSNRPHATKPVFQVTAKSLLSAGRSFPETDASGLCNKPEKMEGKAKRNAGILRKTFRTWSKKPPSHFSLCHQA